MMNTFSISVGNFSLKKDKEEVKLFYKGQDVSGFDIQKVFADAIAGRREHLQKITKVVEKLDGAFEEGTSWSIEDVNVSFSKGEFKFEEIVAKSKKEFLEAVSTLFYDNEHSKDEDLSDYQKLLELVKQFNNL